jgi:ParB family chromosome partitioning protein
MNTAVPTAAAISSLVESPLNPRRHFNQARLLEMSRSIRTLREGGHPFGVIEPLLVRPVNPAKRIRSAGGQPSWEIIAGARRFRAAKIAGVTELPITASDVDDKTVLEMMTIENEQREDIHPLEQAEGYNALIAFGYTVEELAERIGKEAGYVYRRLQLLHLIEPLKKEFIAERFPYSHAVLLARLAAADQSLAHKEALYNDRGEFDHAKGTWVKPKEPPAVSKADLDSWIRHHVYLELKDAAWKLDDPEIWPEAGSCTACPKRSGANLALFEDLKGSEDRCLDRRCYEQKQRNFIKIQAGKAALAGEELPLVSLGYASSQERSNLPQRTVYDQTEIEKRCEHAERAIVVHAGRHYKTKVGATILICRKKDCNVHGRGRFGAGGPSQADLWKHRANEARQKAELQGRQLLLQTVVDLPRVSLALPEAKWWVLEALVDDVHDEAELLATLRIDLMPEEDGKKVGCLGAIRYAAEKDPAVLERAIIAAALNTGVHFYGHREKEHPNLLNRAAAAVKVDVKKTVAKGVAAVMAEFERRKQASKKKVAAMKKKVAAKGALAVPTPKQRKEAAKRHAAAKKGGK